MSPKHFDSWRLYVDVCRASEKGRSLSYSDSLTVARRAIESLAYGDMAHALVACAAAFETGEDLADDDVLIVAHAWKTRLRLSELLPLFNEVDGTPLMAALIACDATHATRGPALLMLSDEDARDIEDEYGSTLDSPEWWGYHWRLKREVPAVVVTGALRSMSPHLSESDTETLVWAGRTAGHASTRHVAHAIAQELLGDTRWDALDAQAQRDAIESVRAGWEGER